MGTSYALMQALLFWLEGRPADDLFFRVTTGFVSFAMLGLFLTFVHSLKVKRKTGGSSEDSFNVHQQRHLPLHLPYERAFELCCESIEYLGGRIKTADRAHRKIEAQTGWTFRTFGCVISYDLKPIGERLTEIRISSRPKVPTTLVDYGENLENVEALREFLSRRDAERDLNLRGAESKNLSEAKISPRFQVSSPRSRAGL